MTFARSGAYAEGEMVDHLHLTALRHRQPQRGRRWSIALVIALMAASACGSDDSDSAASPTTDAAGDDDAVPVINDAATDADADTTVTPDGTVEPAVVDSGGSASPSDVGPPGLDTGVAGTAQGFRGPDPSGQVMGMGVCTDSFVEATRLAAARVDCTAVGSTADTVTVAVADLAVGDPEIWWFAGPSDSLSACARVSGTLQGLLDMSADGVATGIAVAIVADDGQAWPYMTIPAAGCPAIDVPGPLPEFTGPMPREGGVFVRIDGEGVGEGVCYEPDVGSGSWIRRDGFTTTC